MERRELSIVGPFAKRLKLIVRASFSCEHMVAAFATVLGSVDNQESQMNAVVMATNEAKRSASLS